MLQQHCCIDAVCDAMRFGRRQRLEGAVRNKQKALDAARRKPDPMAKEPELRRSIERLAAKMHGKVVPVVLPSASALASAHQSLRFPGSCTPARSEHGQLDSQREGERVARGWHR